MGASKRLIAQRETKKQDKLAQQEKADMMIISIFLVPVTVLVVFFADLLGYTL